ncbi:fimbrial biogenesis outer membrane usher protein [Pseudomonas sp. FW300-N1A1]|uniref:fimbria/pilus outer membrane usher protein n=1 Tax=Pseudomonas sp. FW300-N1A1 TaxID=2075555 RepID=UPI000CD2CF94|nr:fimbria/pilus outer membrane usher protein [Pseudomonas sp. FW300-N1A1]POA19242.1 fimbrial biogenesis outer membrane usher protein [Pseudomonas sp. FW300-N1A1]
MNSIRLPCCLIYGAMLMSGSAMAVANASADNHRTSNTPEYAAFNPSFFNHGGTEPSVDVSRFEKGTPVEPGVYRLDVYVNETWIGRQPITAVSTGSGKEAVSRYCIKSSQFAELGVDKSKLPAENQLKIVGDCVDFAAAVPDGKIDVDLSSLTASISIPQLYMGRKVAGYVDPSEWDRGVNAGFAMYDTNLYKSDANGTSSTQFYGSLNSGLNVADWRLRYNASYNHGESDDSESTSEYQSISTYAQRDITPLKSQLTMGEYFTPSEVFDSVPFTGAQLASDDRMLPDSQRGFAPDIRGVAETNARVRVKQNNNVIYETSVAPGPFEINDLYNTGYAGDLNVEITEADGRVKSFLVPYASVSQLVRPGVARYSVTAGQYRDEDLEKEPSFVQGTYQYGINNVVTAYTGSIIADNYLSGLGGMAFSTPVGALALDVTLSHASDLPEDLYGVQSSMSGQSYRLTYSKLLEATATNMTLAAYRFNSEDYLSLQDFAQIWGGSDRYLDDSQQRNRYQLSVNQPLGERGSLFFSGSKQNYWNRSASDTSYQAGYNTGLSWGTLGISASRTQDEDGDYDSTYLLSASVPIGQGSGRSMSLSTNINYSDSQNNNLQTSLSGSAGEQREVSYSVYGSGSQSDGDRSSNTGGSVTYNSPHAVYTASGSRGDGYKQGSVGARGSLVAHPGGINFSQNQSETMAIVEAKGAQGAAIASSVGAAVADNGYAVVGGLTPYRQNEIELDPKGTSKDVELQVTSQSVAPRAGAVVMLKYPTTTGAPVLMQVMRDDGELVPLGAEVLDSKGNNLTMVGQGGKIFLRGLEPKGVLIAKWGDGSGQRCRIEYQLPEQAEKDAPFMKASATCRAVLEKPQVAQN